MAAAIAVPDSPLSLQAPSSVTACCQRTLSFAFQKASPGLGALAQTLIPPHPHHSPPRRPKHTHASVHAKTVLDPSPHHVATSGNGTTRRGPVLPGPEKANAVHNCALAPIPPLGRAHQIVTPLASHTAPMCPSHMTAAPHVDHLPTAHPAPHHSRQPHDGHLLRGAYVAHSALSRAVTHAPPQPSRAPSCKTLVLMHRVLT